MLPGLLWTSLGSPHSSAFGCIVAELRCCTEVDSLGRGGLTNSTAASASVLRAQGRSALQVRVCLQFLLPRQASPRSSRSSTKALTSRPRQPRRGWVGWIPGASPQQLRRRPTGRRARQQTGLGSRPLPALPHPPPLLPARSFACAQATFWHSCHLTWPLFGPPSLFTRKPACSSRQCCLGEGERRQAGPRRLEQ